MREERTGEVSVHDPSVFYDDTTKKYYAFGTHFAVACSDDLIHWKQLASSGDSSLLYGTRDFRSVLKEADRIVPYTAKGKIKSTWAPHVEKIGKKYYMYYSLTSAFGSAKSVIGRVSADRVLGPYSHDEIILWSTGKRSPNCIDPQILRDNAGKLWLVYGSFFEGVFIKELDETGLPVHSGEHDYGKLLWKGGKRGVEGPFVFYHKETSQYILMTSDGFLGSDYNMRAARSANPDGPYLDITGANMASAYGGGNKLAGNFQFEGETGTAALGHNSVILANGRYLAVFHSRSRVGAGGRVSENHTMQVRQLFFNADGWPLLSPERYAGERLARVMKTEIAGEYELLLHSEGNKAAFIPSVRCSFTADGKILSGGSEAGSWELSGDYFVNICWNGVSFRGAAVPCPSRGGLCMSAISPTGRSLWTKPVR